MNKTVSDTAQTSSLGRFPQDQQLEESLVIVNKQIHRRPKAGKAVRHDDPPSLPGHPTRLLSSSSENVADLESFLLEEFLTKKLNQMAPHLWLMATQNHGMISPLHQQLVRGRRLTITEDPELHLTWIDDKVFIKPIPPFLLSHAFWEKYLVSSLLSPFRQEATEALQPAILGFLRSWSYLVRHESDFILGRDANLIPRGMQYARFMKFMGNFSSSSITNAEVSPRYQYGQLRLSRLNLWAKVFLGIWEFETIHWQYWQYFQTFYGPLLFIFAFLTVVLSAMQVGLTAPDVWPAFTAVSIWFSVVTLLVVAVTAFFLLTLFFSKGLAEVIFALRAVIRRRIS